MSRTIDLSSWLKGYAPDKRNVESVGYLESCGIFEVGPNGLAEIEAISRSYTLNEVYPFPQLFRGETSELTCYGSLIYENNSNFGLVGTYAIYAPSDYDDGILNSSANGSIIEDGVWHFADLGNAWFIFNGSCVVFKHPSVDDGLFCDSTVYAKTGCAHRGRLWLGGLNSMISSAFNTIVDGYRNYNSGDSIDPGQNWIWYSSVSLEDIFLVHFPWSIDQKQYVDLLERHEFGFIPMRWSGDVRAVKPLGEWVICYGDDGITAIKLSQGIPVRQEIAQFGIDGRGAVGGGDREHVFVGKNHKVYKLSSDLSLVELGYDGVLGTGTFLVVWDEIDRKYYLSSESSTGAFLLTEHGLSRIRYRLLGQVVVNGTKYSSAKVVTVDPGYEFKTGWTVVEGKTPVTAVGVEVSSSNPPDLTAYIYARQNAADTPWATGGLEVDSGGYASGDISGSSFQVRLVAATNSQDIHRVVLHLADHSKINIGDLT